MLYDEAFLRRLEAGLRSVLPRWGFAGNARLWRLAASENASFRLEDANARCVFRVHRPHYHDACEIRSELAWIEALRRDKVVETPRPVPTLDGALLVPFDDKGTRRHVVAFEYMTGRTPDAADDRLRWFGHIGAITARLHRHAVGWTHPAGFRRKRWTFETIVGASAHWGDWRTAPGLDAQGRAVLERVHAVLARETAAFGEAPDRFGLVHCDLRAANLLVAGDRLGVIDFDDCGQSWFGYDFAAAISFIEHEPIVPALMAAWLKGYRTVAPFPEDQARMLPVFAMLRRLQLSAWIATHAETPTAQALGSGFTEGTVRLGAAFLSAPAHRRAAA